jgi:hypothetical protein
MDVAPARTFHQLEQRNLLGSRSQSADARIRERVQRGFNTPLWSWLSTGISVAAAIFALAWWFPPPQRPLVGILLLPWMCGWYMICMIAGRELAMVAGLRAFFGEGDFILDPLHPDRCGGLGPLNHFALTFTYLIAACALGLAIMTYLAILTGNLKSSYLLAIAWAAYFVLAPYCFFGVLGTPHRRMQEAKEQLLRNIAQRFQKEYAEIHRELRDEAQLSHSLEAIQHLRAVYELTESFPVWPFDASSIRRFAGAVLAPLLMFAASFIAESVARRLGGG